MVKIDISKLAEFRKGRTWIDDNPCLSRLNRNGCNPDELDCRAPIHALPRALYASLWRGHSGDTRNVYVAHGWIEDRPMWERLCKAHGLELEVFPGASWVTPGGCVVAVMKARVVVRE